MTKVFIDTFDCKTPCKIFVGKDALSHAIYWIKHKKIAKDATDLYQQQFKFLSAVSWRKGLSSYSSKTELAGNGLHIKMYETDQYLILSSQNNCHSALFESALVFERKKNLSAFFKLCYSKAFKYTTWWKNHKEY